MEIEINGQRIEFASFDTFTLDDAMIVWDYTQMTLDKVGEVEGFMPGVVAALIHVSFQRANPRATKKEVRKLVGELKLTDLEKVFEDITEEADDNVPPPNASDAGNGRNEKTGTSTTSSNGGGEHSPASSPDTAFGLPGLGTPQVASDPVTSGT